MDEEKLLEILDLHKKWLTGDADGERANLSYEDLRGADLCKANLSGANLSRARLGHADLSYANLSAANLRHADLVGADLSKANLRDADLSYSGLRYARLRYSCLYGAYLSGADLRGVDLNSAYLDGAVEMGEKEGGEQGMDSEEAKMLPTLDDIERNYKKKIQENKEKRELYDAMYALCLRALSKDGTKEEREILPLCLQTWFNGPGRF